MTNKEIIIKSIRFIEQNLQNDIDVFKVSREVCYSLYHFIRLFQSITGYSPKNYIQQRRLSEAVNELRNTNKKIADIAYDYQFGSHESFTRAFKKQFHISPLEVRNGQTLTSLPLLMPVTEEYIFRSDKVKHRLPELVTLPEQYLVGLSFFIPDETEINDLSLEWNRLIVEKDSIQNRTLPERYFQVQYWSGNQELGGMYFFTGVQVDLIVDVNPFFVVKVIPAGRYLRFIHKGPANKVGYTYKFIYNQFLPDTDYKLSKPFNFEYYGPDYKGPYNEDSESEIYIPVE